MNIGRRSAISKSKIRNKMNMKKNWLVKRMFKVFRFRKPASMGDVLNKFLKFL